MLNNPALDVAIGLVFLYAVYSLLATTLTELFSSFFSLRGRILRRGIERMLNDSPKIKNANGEKNHLTGTINVKSNLGPQTVYVTMDKPSSDSEKENPSNQVDEKRKEIMLELRAPDIDLSKVFFEYPGIKYLGNGRVFSNKSKLPSYIRPKTFAKSLVKILEKATGVEGDIDKISARLNTNSPTQLFLKELLKEGGGNIEKFKSLAENWFSETMERVEGWFKKWTQLISFIVGLLIAFSMNVDTIAIGKKLSVDKKARLALVEAASTYAKTYAETIDQSDRPDSLKAERIDVLTERIDTLLTQAQSSTSLLEISRPNPFRLIPINKDSQKSWQNVFGCLLTALALSIGAPFWFDLLNKFMKLRGAGTRENGASSKTTNNAVG